MREIEGYRGKYLVFADGRVYSYKRHREVKPRVTDRGYLKIRLSKNNCSKSFFVHRLVAQAYIPNPKNLPFVNHIDGVKLNNHLSNLEWCTNEENMLHARRIGLIHPGIYKRGPSLTLSKISTIRRCIEDGLDDSQIANKLGL